MISMRPGVYAQAAVDALNEAARAASDVVGRGGYAIDLFNGYLSWANDHARILGSILRHDHLDKLITTKRYWTLQGLDPAAYGMALGNFVRLELQERQSALSTAAKAIASDLAIWNGLGGEKLHAAVLDTNVLLRHHDELHSFDWHGHLDLDPHVPVGLAVPIVVVNELDKNKLNHRKMRVRDEGVEVSSLARQALRSLDSLFEGGQERVKLARVQPGEKDAIADTWALLLIDDYDHVPLARPDAEIIDRALSLSAFVPHVSVITYDRGLFFEARRSQLHAVRLDES
ncbi:PIN domain-containing protein [Arthrobacter sp. NPDC080031]|uniref:PIN domain-containing protein n=1 Tax=Arthrobacter sp. NPDC080031 TaxID=3155918 RepID=UPI00344FACD8